MNARRARASFLKLYPRFNSFPGKLWQLTWYAHIGACLLDPSATLRYIGRYTKRAVLAFHPPRTPRGARGQTRGSRTQRGDRDR